MDSVFLGQITQFAGDFAPENWAFCDGQTLSTKSHGELFTLLSNRFGGDGIDTFALPDLRGRAAMHSGTGQGLAPRQVGEKSGTETVTLNLSQMPRHNHPLVSTWLTADNQNPKGDALASARVYTSTLPPVQELDSLSLSETGGGQAHENQQPYLVTNFIIALAGIYPSRT
ncbi:tail protein [Amylibacter marinus]|uniref:Tail protein n=1 Tax=Amylibacter marinus TaxID=1475483 RepID=A0ABQ5VRZ9_9RHOB|nr:tail fiber protein [Amylibacter marinus]GLQ34042.1 tail protein [Amylibacter marinus]